MASSGSSVAARASSTRRSKACRSTASLVLPDDSSWLSTPAHTSTDRARVMRSVERPSSALSRVRPSAMSPPNMGSEGASAQH